MPADLILTAGPFLGANPESEIGKLAKHARLKGYPFWRAHLHKRMIVVEAWKRAPVGDWEPLPKADYLDSLIAKEIAS